MPEVIEVCDGVGRALIPKTGYHIISVLFDLIMNADERDDLYDRIIQMEGVTVVDFKNMSSYHIVYKNVHFHFYWRNFHDLLSVACEYQNHFVYWNNGDWNYGFTYANFENTYGNIFYDVVTELTLPI